MPVAQPAESEAAAALRSDSERLVDQLADRIGGLGVELADVAGNLQEVAGRVTGQSERFGRLQKTAETMVRPRFETSGGSIAFTDVGSGPPVLLLHAFPLWSIQWRHFIPALAARSRVIAPDLLGAGESAMPSGRALGIAEQAGYVRELLEHLGIDRLAVVGHGSGGGIAQLLALRLVLTI